MNNFIVVPANDAEAVAIGEILSRNGVEHAVTGQAWGASWENLEPEIMAQVDNKILEGYAVYGVELQGDAPIGCVNIDHHKYDGDDRSNSLTSIEQISNLLGVELTAYERAVALNDKGYIPLMEEAGVPAETISAVRLADRKAQGVTAEMEEQAERACASKEVVGSLTIVRLPHSKTSTVCDRLYGQYENLLVLSADGETNFFGSGAVIAQLQEKFGGWSGGQLPKTGFWGGYPNQDEVEAFVKASL